MTVHPELAAVVLAGGEGRRMGGRKPHQAWGRATLLARALDYAGGQAGAVAVCVRDPAQLDGSPPVAVLLDEPSLAGPLAGLAAALGWGRANGARAVLLLPCDAPRLPDDLASRLAAHAGRAPVVMPMSHGHWHPTCALWRSDIDLEAYLATGRRSLRGLAEQVGAHVVDWGAIEPDPFASANTPDDLDRLRRLDAPGSSSS